MYALAPGGASIATGSQAAALAGGTPAAGASPLALGGIGSAGNVILPVAGIMGGIDALSNNYNFGRSVAQGAASGAAIGSYFGPAGAGIGAGVGALVGGVKNQLFSPSKTKEEQKRRSALEKAGIVVENAGTKEWEGNEKFRASRKESDLTGTDIKNAATLYQTFGKDYVKLSAPQRAAIGQLYLNAGKVREVKGRIDIDYSDAEVNKQAKALLESGLVQETKSTQNSNRGGGRRSENKRPSSPVYIDNVAPTAPAPVRSIVTQQYEKAGIPLNLVSQQEYEQQLARLRGR
jgi:hypothetical protein